MKSKFLLLGILALAIVGIVLISGYVQKVVQQTSQALTQKKFRLQEGKWYNYEWVSKDQNGKKMDVDLIITEIQEERWKGILGMRGGGYQGNEAILFKFKVSKDDLSLTSTLPLNVSQLQGDVKYYSMKELQDMLRGEVSDAGLFYFVLPIPLFKEVFGLYPPELFNEGSARLIEEHGAVGTLKMEGKVENEWELYSMTLNLSDSGTVSLFTSTAKPYPLLNLSMTGVQYDSFEIRFNNVKDFDLSNLEGYYSGYRLKTAPKVNLAWAGLGPGSCENGKALIGIRNEGVETISTGDIKVYGYRDGEEIDPLEVLWRKGEPPQVSWEKDVTLKPGEFTIMKATCTTPRISASCKYRLSIKGETLDVSKTCS